MKKLVAVLAPLACVLSACATTNTANTGTTVASGLATTAIKVAVQAKCVTEIEKNSSWQAAARLLTQNQQQTIKSEVCGCVGEKATTSISATDIMVAALDQTSQANLAAKLVTQTLNACVVDVLKQ